MVDETPSVSALQMDRGLPIGNSQDIFGRRALHVKMSNNEDEAAPVNIFPGTPWFDDSVQDTTPGADQILISTTVPSGFTRNVYRIELACRVSGLATFLINGATAGLKETGPANPNVSFSFGPPRSVGENVTYEVHFQARESSPVVSVGAFLQAADISN